jgi:hypothetical protein
MYSDISVFIHFAANPQYSLASYIDYVTGTWFNWHSLSHHTKLYTKQNFHFTETKKINLDLHAAFCHIIYIKDADIKYSCTFLNRHKSSVTSIWFFWRRFLCVFREKWAIALGSICTWMICVENWDITWDRPHTQGRHATCHEYGKCCASQQITDILGGNTEQRGAHHMMYELVSTLYAANIRMSNQWDWSETVRRWMKDDPHNWTDRFSARSLLIWVRVHLSC